MKNIQKIFTLILLLLAFTGTQAQFVTPFIPPVNPEPTVKEIFQKIQDTLNVKSWIENCREWKEPPHS